MEQKTQLRSRSVWSRSDMHPCRIHFLQPQCLTEVVKHDMPFLVILFDVSKSHRATL